MAGDVIRMGRVSRPHGVSGEVEIRLDWAESRGLLEVSCVLLEGPSGERREFPVEAARQTAKGLLLRLAGVSDRDAAEALKGQVVYVSRQELPSLGNGEYYLCDLLGFEVVTPEGRLGEVVQVEIYPSVDALVIQTASGERFEQPLMDEWLEQVSIDERRIRLSSIGGLIEVPAQRAGKQRRSES